MDFDTVTLEELSTSTLDDLSGSLLSASNETTVPRGCLIGADYKTISDKFSHLFAALDTSFGYLNSAATFVAALDLVEPTRDLVEPICKAQDLARQIADRGAYFSAVRAINTHVIRRSQYATLDEYLEGESIALNPAWAEVCGMLGYTVSEDNIE